jgi:hypothetical protein
MAIAFFAAVVALSILAPAAPSASQQSTEARVAEKTDSGPQLVAKDLPISCRYQPF